MSSDRSSSTAIEAFGPDFGPSAHHSQAWPAVHGSQTPSTEAPSTCTCAGIDVNRKNRFQGHYTLHEEPGDEFALGTTTIRWKPSWTLCGDVPADFRHLNLLKLRGGDGEAEGTDPISKRVSRELQVVLRDYPDLVSMLNGARVVSKAEKAELMEALSDVLDEAGREAVLSLYPEPCDVLSSTLTAPFNHNESACLSSEYLGPQIRQPPLTQRALSRVREILDSEVIADNPEEMWLPLSKLVERTIDRHGPKRPCTITREAWETKLIETCANLTETALRTLPDPGSYRNIHAQSAPFLAPDGWTARQRLMSQQTLESLPVKPFEEASHLITKVSDGRSGEYIFLVSPIAAHASFADDMEMSDVGSSPSVVGSGSVAQP